MNTNTVLHVFYVLVIVLLTFGSVFYVEDMHADFSQQVTYLSAANRALNTKLDSTLTQAFSASEQQLATLRQDVQSSTSQLQDDLDLERSRDRKLVQRVRAVNDKVSTIQTPPDVTALADRALRSVVRIEASLSTEPDSSQIGTGFFVTGNGDIVTNAHVILVSVFTIPEDPDQEPEEKLVPADRISVTLKDGRVFDAWIVNYDQSADVAVLRINERVNDFLRWGDSTKLKEGNLVVALGNPLDLAFTTTAGIVSAFRNENGIPFIQFDASISFGSSGGPLINSQGQVVGINSAGIPFLGDFGFAIASEFAQPIVSGFILNR